MAGLNRLFGASAIGTELGATVYPVDQVTSAALRAHLKAETGKWAPIIKSAGVYAD